jgi:hypothetical protein
MRRLHIRWYMWLAPLLALAVGYATRSSQPAPARAASSVPGSSLTLEYPVSWRETSLPVALGDLDLKREMVLAPRGDASNGGLLAVSVDEGRDLLPRAVLAKLAGRLEGEAISLVGSLAFRYEHLSIAGSDIRLTAYSIPAGAGRYTLAICFAPPGAAKTRTSCEQIVERSETPAEGAEGSAELEPQPSYAGRLSSVLRGLQSTQTQARATMAGAPTATTVAREAARLADAFAHAGAMVGKLDPPAVADGANSVLERSMLTARLAYAVLAQAAEAESNGSFAPARRRVQQAEAGFAHALEGLALLGYRIG